MDDEYHIPDKKQNKRSADKYDLSIRPMKTSKHNLIQRPFMKAGAIPMVNTVTMFCGRSGSGKTCLLVNLLSRSEFYGRDHTGKQYFDETIIFSKTGGTALDDTYDNIDWLTEDNFIHDLDPASIDNIVDAQKKHIEENGFGSRKVLIVMDDILSEPKFIRSKQFLKLFVELRHYCCTVFVCTQSFTRIPRPCRLQITNLFYFPSSMDEQETLAETSCPANMNKKTFIALIQYATSEKHSFLYINNKLPIDDRFRKNLTEIIVIPKNI